MSKKVRSSQVWEHMPEQRVTVSTLCQYSKGLFLTIHQADAGPIPISLRCSSTCCSHEELGQPVGLLHS